MPSNQQPSIGGLFISFLRLGSTAFGGPSMVDYIRRMAVEKKQWLDEDSFRNGVALCQAIPGATAMQTAAYVGLKTRGAAGAAASFIGFGLPAFFLMVILSALYGYTHNLSTVVSAFSGLQAVIVAIVANAALSFGRAYLKTWKQVIIAGIAAILFGLGVNPIAVILIAALLGIALIGDRQISVTSIEVAGKELKKAPHSMRPLLFLITAAAIWFLLLFLVHPGLFDLAVLMSRIDLFAFGGGFASVPLMYHEIVGVRSWMDGKTFLNGILLGQVTPGPIVITATFAGYWLYGFAGALVASISVFLPSFMLVVGLAPYFDRLRSLTYFNKVIGGILCSFVGLLLTVTFNFAGNVHWDLFHIILACTAFFALLMKVDILWVVMAGTVISVLAFR
ncbi:MAG: chromate efflux transporter [Candidatus Schekmanbacteria bacterium]|nr:chromate efflux transporter [Candidatus Schekmanbacteria bacterium]